MAGLRARIDRINAVYRDVRPGDRYSLTYQPGRGTELALNGTVDEPASSGEALADVGDRHLWPVLESVASAVLVTGEDALGSHAPDPARVLSPHAFVARLAG